MKLLLQNVRNIAREPFSLTSWSIKSRITLHTLWSQHRRRNISGRRVAARLCTIHRYLDTLIVFSQSYCLYRFANYSHVESAEDTKLYPLVASYFYSRLKSLACPCMGDESRVFVPRATLAFPRTRAPWYNFQAFNYTAGRRRIDSIERFAAIIPSRFIYVHRGRIKDVVVSHDFALSHDSDLLQPTKHLRLAILPL